LKKKKKKMDQLILTKIHENKESQELLKEWKDKLDSEKEKNKELVVTSTNYQEKLSFLENENRSLSLAHNNLIIENQDLKNQLENLCKKNQIIEEKEKILGTKVQQLFLLTDENTQLVSNHQIKINELEKSK